MRSASRANTRSVVAPSMRRHLLAGAALLARAEDLDDGLCRREIARGGDLLDERLDVRAEKLGRAVADVADEMKVARVAVGRLEPRTALAEIDLAGDAGAHHPLQRAVDGGAADSRILAADEVAKIVRAQMTLLAQEDAEDAVAFAGALAAGRAQARDVRKRAVQRGLEVRRNVGVDRTDQYVRFSRTIRR